MSLKSTQPISRELEGRTIAIKVKIQISSPAFNPAWSVSLNSAWAHFLTQDNIGIASIPCTNGTSAMPDWRPSFDATLVTRVLDAGGLITGKSGMIRSVLSIIVVHATNECVLYRQRARTGVMRALVRLLSRVSSITLEQKDIVRAARAAGARVLLHPGPSICQWAVTREGESGPGLDQNLCYHMLTLLPGQSECPHPFVALSVSSLPGVSSLIQVP